MDKITNIGNNAVNGPLMREYYLSDVHCRGQVQCGRREKLARQYQLMLLFLKTIGYPGPSPFLPAPQSGDVASRRPAARTDLEVLQNQSW